MRNYICLHCGHHFTEEEIDAKYYDYATGTYDSEECPNCDSEDFEEAEHCDECDEWFPVGTCANGICESCMEKHASDFDIVKRYGDSLKEERKINGFFSWMFTDDEIDEILEREARSSLFIQEYMKKYATQDPDDFTMWLKKEEKKDD